MPDATADPAIGLYFKVKIDRLDGEEIDLGTFISCEGLALEVETETIKEGGTNDFLWKLPTRISYSNVKLTRPVGPESARVALWFARLAVKLCRTTAQVVALTPDGRELVSWTLKEVIPVRWQGPSFSAESPKAATETLELAHHGFTFESGAAGGRVA